MNEFLLISSMAIVTFVIRYPVLALSGRFQLSEQFLQILGYVPPAVLMAIVAPTVLLPEGDHLLLSYTNARLIGAIAAFGVGVWRKNLLLTIVVGMAAFWGWQAIAS
ncbi:MAG: AzlD domain-containing protein [Timaviella obliquedivisa GSE-PSE-MK23-08B]|jgi:branched-subunit amino acid transport protein|nr:AzlD domain-containing protein [Timaviella obliquedivisa GSE-PSE-MK23-08B]